MTRVLKSHEELLTGRYDVSEEDLLQLPDESKTEYVDISANYSDEIEVMSIESANMRASYSIEV